MGQVCSSQKEIKIKLYSTKEIENILNKQNGPQNVDNLAVQFKYSIQNLFISLEYQMKQAKQKLLFETERRTALNSIYKMICILMQNYYTKFQQQSINNSYPKIDQCITKILIETYFATKTLNSKEEIWWSSNYFQVRYRALSYEFKISITHLKPTIESPFIEHIKQLIEIIEFLISQHRCDFDKKTTLQIAESHLETNHFYNELKHNVDFQA